MTIESDHRVLREVVLDQLTTGEIRAYRMWLPPLADPTGAIWDEVWGKTGKG